MKNITVALLVAGLITGNICNSYYPSKKKEEDRKRIQQIQKVIPGAKAQKKDVAQVAKAKKEEQRKKIQQIQKVIRGTKVQKKDIAQKQPKATKQYKSYGMMGKVPPKATTALQYKPIAAKPLPIAPVKKTTPLDDPGRHGKRLPIAQRTDPILPVAVTPTPDSTVDTSTGATADTSTDTTGDITTAPADISTDTSVDDTISDTSFDTSEATIDASADDTSATTIEDASADTTTGDASE